MGKNYTQEQVINAIRGSGGIISTIRAKLGCKSWETARNYITKWKATEKAFQEEREVIGDLCEGVILERIKELKDEQLAKWVLTRLFKDRGYGDTLEVEQNSRVVIIDDVPDTRKMDREPEQTEKNNS